jgi:N-acetylmuramoyl-L-alanine amidase
MLVCRGSAPQAAGRRAGGAAPWRAGGPGAVRVRLLRLPITIVFFALAAAVLVPPPRAATAEETLAPIGITLKTIENAAGVRVILEFSRKPAYEVRGDKNRIYLTVKDGPLSAPFKKRDHDGKVLERIKFLEGFRASEIVFYAGDDFGTFSTFEMGEPFRIVLDMRRRQGPSVAVGVPGPGSGGVAAPAPAGPGAPIGEMPPQPTATPQAEPTPALFTVVIDPGHGGDDTGARGPTGLLEKDITLDVARRLKARVLADMGAQVILTRDSDKAVGLDERTAIANHSHADLFVSIHANASRRTDARGAETYFLSYQATDDDSRAVAAIENNTLGLEEGMQGNSSLEMILWDLAQSAFLKESSALADMVQEKLNDTLGINNRGIKQAPFRVLMGATMPAVLIEVAFISNPDEEARLRDAAFKDRLAAAIEDSIRRFHDKYARAPAR